MVRAMHRDGEGDQTHVQHRRWIPRKACKGLGVVYGVVCADVL